LAPVPAFFLLSVCILALIGLDASAWSGEPRRARIGVLANWGVERCLADWTPMIRALSQARPDIEFSLVPLPFEAVDDAVDNARIDFAVVNPAIYVNLEVAHDVIRIATLVNHAAGRSTDRFGGALFTRADRKDIRVIKDIKGKRLAATSSYSLGGWILGLDTLVRSGVDPGRDVERLIYSEAHDKVVLAVLEGRADVGTVRTDTLERLAAAGKLDMSALKVLTPEGFTPDPSFPFVYSTRLVPEWPFAKLRHTPDDLAKAVAAALFLLRQPDGGGAAGLSWTVPLPYESIHEIMRELRIAPYTHHGQVSVPEFTRQHPKLVGAMALMLLGLVASGLYQFRLNRRLHAAQAELTRQANTDALTGLCNRKRFNEKVEAEIARALRYGRPLAMLLVDLDSFKAINDQHGHPVGDEVLAAAAARIAGSVRHADLAARVGGEEFAVLLPETDVGAAALLAERIRSAIASSPLAAAGEGMISCTASIGVAGVCPLIQNHSALYTAADEALYQAKRLGKNRVELSGACARRQCGGQA
jgi:diguanylate cyclase (GGDEF)-like protein